MVGAAHHLVSNSMLLNRGGVSKPQVLRSARQQEERMRLDNIFYFIFIHLFFYILYNVEKNQRPRLDVKE